MGSEPNEVGVGSQAFCVPAGCLQPHWWGRALESGAAACFCGPYTRLTPFRQRQPGVVWGGPLRQLQLATPADWWEHS